MINRECSNVLYLLCRAQAGIISNATFNDILKYCNFSDVGPFVTSEFIYLSQQLCLEKVYGTIVGRRPQLPEASDCMSAVTQADNEMGNINLYDIYVETCLGQEEADGQHFGNGGLSLSRK